MLSKHDWLRSDINQGLDGTTDQPQSVLQKPIEPHTMSPCLRHSTAAADLSCDIKSTEAFLQPSVDVLAHELQHKRPPVSGEGLARTAVGNLAQRDGIDGDIIPGVSEIGAGETWPIKLALQGLSWFAGLVSGALSYQSPVPAYIHSTACLARWRVF